MIGMWTYPFWVGRVESKTLVLTIPKMFEDLFRGLLANYSDTIFTQGDQVVAIHLPVNVGNDSAYLTYGMYPCKKSPCGLIIVLYVSPNGRGLFGMTATDFLRGSLDLAPLRDKGAKFEQYNLLTLNVG